MMLLSFPPSTVPEAGTRPAAPRRPAALLQAHRLVSAFGTDVRRVLAAWRALPHFLRNLRAYRRAPGAERLPIRLGELYYTTGDRFYAAGTARGHYFHQDLWAARELHMRGVTEHVDVGSRLDGFVAHVLPFCRVTFVDLRPLEAEVPNLEFRQGSILALPYADGAVPSLSCLHVIEHIGLGRYGDPVDPRGHELAARELVRVLAPGGRLLVGTPVGRERLCFDAHRVFDPDSVVRMFEGLRLERFALIDDTGLRVRADAGFDDARACDYGCGLFVFTRDAA